jgi:V-type H+-transporting ATPase subunit H
MSVDPPEFVRSLQNSIRSRPIPWEGAVRAKTISEAHLRKIKAIDKAIDRVRRETRKRTVESETAEYVSLFLGRQDEPGILQTAAKRQDIVLYLLVLLEDLIQGIDGLSIR